jgi:hypothetical protein
MSRDMTIESALSDPMIRAMLRADKVEPKSFERLLRSKATSLAPNRGTMPATPRSPRAFLPGFCCA